MLSCLAKLHEVGKWLPTYQWWHFMHTTWHVHIRSHSLTTIVSFTRYKDGPQSWSTLNVMAHPSIQEVIHTSHHTLIVTLYSSKKNKLAKHSWHLFLAKGILLIFLTLSIKNAIINVWLKLYCVFTKHRKHVMWWEWTK